MAGSADDFHKWAKDAGNKLRAYMLSYSSAATGVFFLALTGKDVSFDRTDKILLGVALLMYVATTVLCLIELRVDARRFFHVAKQLDAPAEAQDWATNERFKRDRLRLIITSYGSAILATLAVVAYLLRKIA